MLATPLAVILGLTYNFLPFMTLPLYASLEKQDRCLVPAAGDLYASSWTCVLEDHLAAVAARGGRPARC